MLANCLMLKKVFDLLSSDVSVRIEASKLEASQADSGDGLRVWRAI